MKKKYFLIFIFLFITKFIFGQYLMSNQTVYECEGTLTDSEANSVNSGWYDNNENFSFTICPSGAYSIAINFISFVTEPINDYVMIYDGPDNTYPILGGPYSGVNLPPQIVSNGCVTITFVSDLNVTAEGFELSWEAQVNPPVSPIISLPNTPSCSLTTLIIELDRNIHCDSVYTANYNISGQLNQNISASPINCINDSTNSISLTLSPGLNESGLYDLYFESTFIDVCNDTWILSNNLQFFINDCPLQVDLSSNSNDTICLGECVDLYVNVIGGDSSSYSYSWLPFWLNSPGVQTVCPTVTTQYNVTVDDLGPSVSASDSIVIHVLQPPTTQSPVSICQTDNSINLTANPVGGSWSGTGIVSSQNGEFSPSNLVPGIYTVTYSFQGCDDDLDITVLEVDAGNNLSACINSSVFNLNSNSSPSGGVWSGSANIQANGDVLVGSSPAVLNAIYTLANGCSDTLSIDVVNNIVMPADTTLCQNSGNYSLSHSPSGGVWSVVPSNNLLPSNCSFSISSFPLQESWENGFNLWVQDPNNDFDWTTRNGSTPSGQTGPSSAFDEDFYIYTEASGANNPYKTAAIISPCLNLSMYSNPVLNFWFHMYDGNSNNGINQGTFSVDVSMDNGLNWIDDIWFVSGNNGNQWLEASIDLSNYISTDLLIRLRVITGDSYQSDVAVDKLSVLGGPVTPDGDFLSDVAGDGLHILEYSIQGCSDFVNITINEIDAGVDLVACPEQMPFNLTGLPSGGMWNGLNITNNFLGTFDPSINLGSNLIVYSFNGCNDTIDVTVVDTELQIDSLSFCLNSGLQQLNLTNVPRTPWNGNWSGQGITTSIFPGEFNPNNAGVGVHDIIYEANTCFDTLVVNILPRSVLLDTLICSSSSDIILNVYPPGGSWAGNGIINNSTGLFSPSQLSVGTHYLRYSAPNSCVDTFSINIYNSPVLSLNGLNDFYCFNDTNVVITTNPSIGGTLFGNGIQGNVFNPSVAGSGYHVISYTYGSGSCSQTIDTVVLVGQELMVEKYTTKDSLCVGDYITLGANASGGNGNYIFDWNNNLSNSFEHLISPISSTDYIVTISDGCSNDATDTIQIYVYPNFDLSFTTSQKLCFGELGYSKVNVNPAGNYDFIWNDDISLKNDSLIAKVNNVYSVKVTDIVTNCSIEDTITIPGYQNVIAYFSPNTNECVSVLDGEIQFINNSIISVNEISTNSYWDFGDGNTSLYSHYESPFHTYIDTGIFNVTLFLENIGGCSDSISSLICILPDFNLYVPNSFTPNTDKCNDEFYVKGVGGFYSFNLQIHKRWGSEIIFESDEIILTTHIDDGNKCNSIVNSESYYKMGTWDGIMNNGKPAPQGVYPYLINYQQTQNSDQEQILGYIILIR